MSYIVVKNLHIATVVITFALFVLRGFWMMADSPRLQARWVRIAPHANDTVLLLSGLGLASLIGQYPFAQGWLTAKFLALIAYIVLGTIALKRGRTRNIRIGAWIAALLVFFYMVRVALTHDPLPL